MDERFFFVKKDELKINDKDALNQTELLHRK